MNKALIFPNRTEVTAVEVRDWIQNGTIDRHAEFVDPEYEYKVTFVSSAKNNGSPYFRLYYSYEDYKRLFPDRADHYAMVANMRHYQETQWHKAWETDLSRFCEIEKYFKDPIFGSRRRADAYNPKTNTVIEVQYSYIANDFEDRNSFYKRLGIKTIWIYALPKAMISDQEGVVEILEDNARGFFRISEKPGNLTMCPVFIQVRNGSIYRVRELKRRESTHDLESTIRYFDRTEVYSREEFIQAIERGMIDGAEPLFGKDKDHATLFSSVNDAPLQSGPENQGSTIYELWESAGTNIKSMVVRNLQSGKTIRVFHGGSGTIFEMRFPWYRQSAIAFHYVTCKEQNGRVEITENSPRDYALSPHDANSKIWKLVEVRHNSIMSI